MLCKLNIIHRLLDRVCAYYHSPRTKETNSKLKPDMDGCMWLDVAQARESNPGLIGHIGGRRLRTLITSPLRYRELPNTDPSI